MPRDRRPDSAPDEGQPGRWPKVVPDPDHPGAWLVRVGGADQSWVDPDQPEVLVFDYMQRIAHHLDAQATPGERLRVVHIGGAGLSLPRYVASTRPTSPQIVLEPDQELTAEVREKIPLAKNSGIKIRPVDGRTGVAAMPADYAEVVIVDAFVGARVPAELVTVEAFAELRRITIPGAQVLFNLTDLHPFAWTRRVLAGLAIYFPQVAMSAESSTLKGRRFGNVVIGASTGPLPLDHLNRKAAGAAFPYRVVSGDQLTQLVGRAQPFHDGAGEPSPPPPSGLTAFS